nr:hypothetical protein [Lysinibacillus timonensis]
MTKYKLDKLEDLSQNKEKVVRNVLQKIRNEPVKRVRWQYPILTLILTASVALFLFFQTDIKSFNFLATEIEEGSKVMVKPQIAPLTDEEFKYVGTSEVPNATKEDFRKFTFTFRVEDGLDVISRDIEILYDSEVTDSMYKGWDTLMKEIDGFDRYWYGSGWEQDNDGGDFADYYYEFILYTRGISEEEIRQAFDKVVFRVTLTREEERFVKDYRVSDYLKFVK